VAISNTFGPNILKNFVVRTDAVAESPDAKGPTGL